MLNRIRILSVSLGCCDAELNFSDLTKNKHDVDLGSQEITQMFFFLLDS